MSKFLSVILVFIIFFHCQNNSKAEEKKSHTGKPGFMIQPPDRSKLEKPGSSDKNASLPGQNDVVIEHILMNSSQYSDQTVAVIAIYRGWKGKCKNPPPISRSDWMIEQKDHCVYVHGKAPTGLRPLRPKPVVVKVSGLVKLDTRGNVYLEAVTVHRQKSGGLPPLPDKK